MVTHSQMISADTLSDELHQKYDAMSAEELNVSERGVSIAGRMMTHTYGQGIFRYIARHGRPYSAIFLVMIYQKVSITEQFKNDSFRCRCQNENEN